MEESFGEYRSIYQSMFDDSKVRKLPIEARWLFIGLICRADKWGRWENDTYLMWRDIFFSDSEIKEEKIAEWIELLAKVNMIQLYSKDDHKYLYIRKWMKYQRFRYISKYRYPTPPGFKAEGIWLKWEEAQEEDKEEKKFDEEHVKPKEKELEAEKEEKKKLREDADILVDAFFKHFSLPIGSFMKQRAGAKRLIEHYGDPETALQKAVEIADRLRSDPWHVKNGTWSELPMVVSRVSVLGTTTPTSNEPKMKKASEIPDI